MKASEFVYCDSNIFLSYFLRHSERFLDIRAVFNEATQGQFQLITSTLTVTEVSHLNTEKMTGILNPAITERIDNFWSNEVSLEFVPVGIDTAKAARDLIRWGIGQGFSLRPFDALHLATAQLAGARRFLTYDVRLVKYADYLGYPITPPLPPS